MGVRVVSSGVLYVYVKTENGGGIEWYRVQLRIVTPINVIDM